MGIRLWLCAVSDDTVRLLMEKPHLRESVMEDVAKPPATQSVIPAVRWLKRLIDRNRAAVEGDNLLIDKAWHGIHYLLTGTAWAGDPPLNFLLAGGREISDDDDNSTIRLYSANEVREIGDALAALDHDKLRAAYNPSAMSELDIYPNIWQRDSDALEYCIHHFVALKTFIMRVRDGGLGMVTEV